jgi:hypothetical protein
MAGVQKRLMIMRKNEAAMIVVQKGLMIIRKKDATMVGVQKRLMIMRNKRNVTDSTHNQVSAAS